MPPSSASHVDQGTMSSFPYCCAFPIGEIEVQAVEGPAAKTFATRIFMSPVTEPTVDATTTTDQREEESRPLPSPPQPSRYDYFTTAPGSPGEKSLADSFDSTDEIVENSNEAKLIKRVVEKRTGMHYSMESGWQPTQTAQRQQQQSLNRQDSLSDTNSVNSNDVFMIEEAQEMEYLDVLDDHLMSTNPEETNYARLDFETDDFHPRKHQANLDDIIEHLCSAPCGECLPDSPFGHHYPSGYPRSVLRKSKYSSPDEAIVISSSNKLVRFQNVDIREFKMTLGNHPSATSGPPVMLDSEPFSPRKVMTLEQYESTRPSRRKRRQLKLSLQQRHNILVKERGFAFEEVKHAWQEALEIRKQRKETLERGLALMKWDEVWESTCRKFSRLVDGAV
mmetsp:Transcript_20451/g.35938  ORF Transcript_20451/g.35938 Transcript_20451/m.35938 type:complete len:393 (-) Transcript_20451:771-1949(-)